MRSFSTTLVALGSLLSAALATPHVQPTIRQAVTAEGLPSNGIPTVDNLKTAACKPWIAAAVEIQRALLYASPFSLALEAAGLPNGAADGSMLADPNEVLRPANNGLQTIVGLLRPLPAQFGVSHGDVLHLAGVLGVLACPGGPKIKTYVGRGEPKNISPDGLLPDPNDPVPVLTARFADMGFSVRELIALIGAHSTGKQRFVDPAFAGDAFDSTVDIWDVRFYSETQNRTAAPGTFRLNSDVNFSHNASTIAAWNRFVRNQDSWEGDYSKAHEKMSLLGLDADTLTDCTEILPRSIDISSLTVPGFSGDGDPTVDPVKLEAAIQEFRSIWL
ncbi:heme peroxidase [Mycena belliarum]|uniref:Peroxidase n=1 Tax=Mycena belliarum TaxID=1033014 RepID=A0AAD6U540_9AGAR|nr:heme peroxidase [Mycena belliae]